MKKKMMLANLLLALFLAGGLANLYRELSRPAEAGPMASLADFKPVTRTAPELLPEYPDIFEIKPSGKGGAAAGAAGGGEEAVAALNFRLRGIFALAGGGRLAVIEVLDSAGNLKETSRVTIGQSVADLTVAAIGEKSVSLTGPDGETISPRIFKRE